MNWNIALNKFTEIKNQAAASGADLWNYDPNHETCLEYWVRLTGTEEFADMISRLELTEYGDYLLLRYRNLAEVLTGIEDATMDTFWELYDGFYRECRSVVIDIRNDCLVLAPFRKFRNLNEGEETSLENIRERISKASCVEFSNKLDGSMQSARFYRGEIVMAGSQSLDCANSWRLADGRRMLMQLPGYSQMLKENAHQTFIFEYISRRDAHVVKYDEEGLFLIGIRDITTGAESSYSEVLEFAARYHIPTTEVFDKTLDEVLHELDSRQSSEAEGFVLNIDGFKVKIKYNDYVYMHKMLSTITSPNVIIQAIAEDHFDDLIAKVPTAYRDRVMEIAKEVFDYQKRTDEAIAAHFLAAPKGDKKEFMIWVTKNVPKRLQGYVRNRYLGETVNVLKRGDLGYLRLKDMNSTS